MLTACIGQVFNTPEVVKVYVGSFNTARAASDDDCPRADADGSSPAQSPPNLERNPMAAQLFEKEQQARPQPLC